MAHSTPQLLIQKLNHPAIEAIEVGALYYHYKNPSVVYKVLAIGLQEESEELCVIYQNCSDTKLIWVRAISSWLSTVEHANTLVPRFQKCT